MNKSKYNILSFNKKCACPQFSVIKRAALMFDHIYTWDSEIPSSIKINNPKIDKFMEAHYRKVGKHIFFNSPKLKKPASTFNAEDSWKIYMEVMVKSHAECLRQCGYSATPIYDTQERYLFDYGCGKTFVYQAALENLPDIIEDLVSWEQILEVRNDGEAIRKYRELRLWLEYSLSAQSIEHARDLIAKKIEDYEWAIRKHGLKTATGALSTIFDWKGLISAGAGASIGAALGGPVWSILTGTLLTVGRASVWIAERMIEMQDIKHSPDSVVALICDARKLVGKNNT